MMAHPETSSERHAARPAFFIYFVMLAPVLLGQQLGGGKLPFGYATVFLFVLIPPLWFRLMNPRVEAMREKNPISP